MSNFSTSDILFKALDGQINIDSAQGIVECFVAAIGNKDSVGDVIVSGAFTESLKRRKPRVVWGHNWNDPIGKVLEIYEVPANDPRIPTKMRMAGVGGLYSKVQFNLATEKGREAFASVAFFGHEQEWSIGYKTLQATFDPTMQANVLREVELYEVSPVLHGANQLTATLSVKSDEGGEKCGPGGMHGPATMDIPRFNLIPLKPASISSHNEREDIFGEGEAAQLGDEARAALEMELASRSSSPIRVTSATENTVVFDRGMPDGTRITYRLPYHMERHTGKYMFGKPEKMASQQIIPSQMPSMPMMVKPGYVTQSYGNPQQPISMMKSFDEQLDQAIGVLSNAGEDSTVKESELQKIQDAIDYLRNLAGGQQEKTALEYSVWCKPRHAYQVKSLLDPVLEYHRLEAHVDDYGVHITSGLNEESLQAVRSAHKNIAKYLDGGGGSKKDKGASNTKAAPQVRVKALGGKIGPKLGGGLRSAPKGMAFVDITGVTDADSDGIVFEGKEGLERPIIPRFIVPKDLARKLSAVVEGDAEAIERQRRAGNSNVSFDEKKLRGIIDDLGGDPNLLQNLSGDKNRGMRSRSGDEDIEAELDEQADRQFRMNREDSPSKKPKKTVRQLREEARARFDTQAALDDQADMQRDLAREDRGMRSRRGGEEFDVYETPGVSVFNDRQIKITENEDGTFNAFTIENIPGTDGAYALRVGDGAYPNFEAAKRAANREKFGNSRGYGRSGGDGRELDFSEVPGKQVFGDESIRVTENQDGTFNAFTVENVPGSDGGYLRQVGDDVYESLDEAKNAATQRKFSKSRGMRSRSGDEDIEAELDEQADRQFRMNREDAPREKPQKSMRELRQETLERRAQKAWDDLDEMEKYEMVEEYAIGRGANPGGNDWDPNQWEPDVMEQWMDDYISDRTPNGMRSRSGPWDEDSMWTPEEEDLRDLDRRTGRTPSEDADGEEFDLESYLDEEADRIRDFQREDRGLRSRSGMRATNKYPRPQNYSYDSQKPVGEDTDYDRYVAWERGDWWDVSATPTHLEGLADSDDVETRIGVAGNPKTYGTALTKLLNDENEDVRRAADKAITERLGRVANMEPKNMAERNEKRIARRLLADHEAKMRETSGMRSASKRKVYADEVASGRARQALENAGVDPRDLFQRDDESNKDYLDRITPIVEKYAPEIFDGRSLDEFVDDNNVSEVNELIDNALSNHDLITEGLDVNVFEDGMGDPSESRLWMNFVDTESEVADNSAGKFLSETGLANYIDVEGEITGRGRDREKDWSWSIDVSKASPEDKKRFVAIAVSDAIMSHEGYWGRDGFVLRDADRGMRSRIGDAVRKQGREIGKDLKREAKKFAKKKGRELLDDAVDSIFDRDRRDRGMRSRGMLRDEFDFSNRKPDKKLKPAYGRSGPVPALQNMSDDELIKLLESYSEIAPRPWDRNRQSSFLFQDRPSLSSLVQELDSRGYDVYQSQGREPKYFGDYSAGDKGVYARKRGQGSSASGLERMLSEMSGAGGGETRVQDVIDSRLDDRRRGKSKGWKATVPDDYVPSDDALDTLSPQERRLLETFKPKPKWQREQEMLEHFRQQTRRDIDSGKMYDTWDWHPSFEEWDKDYKDRLRKYRSAQRKAYAHDIEKGNVKPEEKPVDEPMGMKDTIDWRLIADDEFIQPLRLGSQTRRYDGFRSAMKDVARRANAAEKNTRPSKEQRALDVLGPISQRGGQAFGLSDAEVQNFFDGGSRLDAGLQKIIKGELRRQGFTNDDIKDLMSGKYSDYVRGRINPPTKRPDLSPEEETWLSELNAITDAAERESLAVLADGLTEDEFADFVRTGKIPNGKESVIRRANEVYDSVSQDKDKQMAMGLRSRSAADIQSAIDANIKKQRDLEKEMDDGKIDLDEFRRRQTPLRQEFAELRKEQGATPSEARGPKLDATGRPAKGMVERDEKGKVKFDSEAFLAEKDRARRARMSELGFSEDEINTLLGRPSQPAGMRSRTSSPTRKYADQQTRENFLKGNNELISNRLGELVTERASVSDEIAQLDKNALEAGRELTDKENSRWDELEGKLSEIDDEIGGIVDFLDYAEQEDIRRIAGKTSNDIARSRFKQMLDDDEISSEDYEKLVDDLIYPGFYDEEYWDSNGGIDAKQGIRSDLGNNSPYNPFEFSQYNSSDEINDAVSGLASELADEKVTDAVRRLRDGGLRSRSGGGKKKKKTSGPSRKLTPEQVRISQEQKLRSKKVPGKKKEGPSKHEWGFRSLNDYGISNNAVVEKLADLFSRDDNDLTDTERSVRNSLIGDGIKIDFSRVGDGDINADISLRNAKDASADEKLDSVIDSITSNEIASDYFNNRGFVVDDRYVDQPSYKREAGLRSRGGYKEWDEFDDDEYARIRRQKRPSNPTKATAPKPDDGDQLIQDASSIEGNDFAASIVKQYKERGRLTQKQWDSLRSAVSRNKKKSPSSSAEKQTENAGDAVRPLSDDDKKAIIDAARKMDSDFARSVVSQYDARGRLSDKQWNALDKSTRKLRNSANNNGGMRSRRSYDDEGGSGGVREGVGESAYNSGSQYIDRLDGDNVKAEVIPAADIYGDDTPGYAVVGEFRTEDGSDYFYGSDEEIFDTVEDAMDFLQNIEDQGNDDVFYTDDNFRSLDRVRSAGQAGRRPLAGLRSRRSYDGEGGSGGVREGVAESEHFSGSMWIDQFKGDNVDADVIPLADIYGDDRPGYGVVGMYRIDDGFGGVEYFYGGDDEEFDSVEDAMDFLQNVEDQGNDGIFYDDPKFRSLDRVRSAGKPGRRPLEGMRSRAAVRKQDELEVGEKFKPGEVVRRRDERGGPVAAPSAPPSGPPNGPNDDNNKKNPFKQKPNFDRAPDNDIKDFNNPRKIADGMRSKAGTRLGESREIYPARRGEKSSAVDFVRYDAAREELVVQYKGGGVYTFGGISAEDADTIEQSESLGKALNDAKRNSTYTVKPNGDVSGVQSDTADFLERDMRRVPMTEDDRRLYSSAIKLLRGNIDEDSDLDAISSQVSRMSDLGNEMWENEDYAAANFLWEAAEKINKKVNSARGGGGFRSRASARHQRMEVNLSADEIGEIRDEIRNIMAKHSGNSLITYGLKKYDNLLEEWQGQKKSNPGRPLTVLSSEYDTIMSSYDELEGTDPDWSKTISADPLEMASISKDGKFSSPNIQKEGSSFDGKRINNGAPEDITPRMQGELIDWGRRQPNFRIVQELLKAHEKNNGQMTARQWSTLRNMFDRFAKENRGGNFRSRTGSGMRSEVGITATSTRKPGLGKGPRTAKEALPEDYNSMSLDEKFDALLSVGKYDEQTNPNGIQVGEYNAAYRRLQDLEDEQDRVAARREALAERMKRAAEAGPVTPRPRPGEEGNEVSAPKVQKTPEERAAIAKKQRQKRLSAIENAVAKIQDKISGAVIDGDADDAHRELWDEVMDLILQEDDGDDADLTLSKLGSIIEALDNYVIGFDGQEMQPAERRSINNAVKVKNTLEELYDEIENDPFVPRGSTSREGTTILAGDDDEVSPTPRFMTGEGLRSRSNLVNDYIGARKTAERKPYAGMRSRSATAQEGRAEIRWEATEFNKVEQALSREISEARNSGDRKTASALQNLMKIMDRQKSGDFGGKRTNAGALYLTQAEIDDVMDALMHVVDRQASTGGSRINLFAQMLDKLAEAGMATFIEKTAKEVNSRFVEKTNEAGRTVRIPLNE